MNEYYANLPRKRVASGALFFNKSEELLILKPTYKDHWTIPGGVVNKDESPRDACVREVKEEIGLNKQVGKMLCADYIKDNGTGENVVFVFDGGILSDEEIERIEIPKDEIANFDFLLKDEALKLFSNGQFRRLKNIFYSQKVAGAIYLENGYTISKNL